MTVAQELKAAVEQIAAITAERAALAEGIEIAKGKLAEVEAKAQTDLAQAKGEMDALKLSRDAAQAAADGAIKELALVKQQLEEAKNKLALAPHKDAVEGRSPVAEVAAEAGSKKDIVALVDAATGAEKMKLYRQHQAEYDKQFAEMTARK